MCNGQCINTQTDANNCGACNSPCNTTNTSSVSCVRGVCQDTCATGFGNCDLNPANGCEKNLFDSDNNNCSKCGGVCPDITSCQPDGMCHCPASKPEACGNRCTNTLSDPNNCDPNGNCGTICPAGGSCVNGACVCPHGQTNCNGQCVDTSSNNTFCGGCSAPPCPTGSSCSSGVCSCNFPFQACGVPGQCSNISNDFFNCGACGMQCANLQHCSDFECRCPDNQVLGTFSDCSSCNDTCMGGTFCQSTKIAGLSECRCSDGGTPGTDTDCKSCGDNCLNLDGGGERCFTNPPRCQMP